MANFISRKRGEDCIDVIDQYLLSDRAPENAMGLSDLDGFLTGIVIGPELILPSEWLPIIWGDDSPKFRNTHEARLIIDAIMERYNEIVRSFKVDPPNFEPVFWETKDGLVIAADWAEGFYDSINLRPQAWKPLFEDRSGLRAMRPIMILCGKQEGASDLDPAEEAEMMRQAGAKVEAAIVAISKFWRGRSRR